MNETFETFRPSLFAISYRMLGSAMDAENMVQETYLRYQATSPGTMLSLKAYLTMIISRLCVDRLQLARRKREQNLDPWLPELIVTTDASELVGVEKRVDEYESISLAFLVMLEQLLPLERAVFEFDYAEIAAIQDKSEVPATSLSAGQGNTWLITGRASHRHPGFRVSCSQAFTDRRRGRDERFDQSPCAERNFLGRWWRQSERDRDATGFQQPGGSAFLLQ